MKNMESSELETPHESFVFPNVEKERGEVERAAEQFAKMPIELFTEEFIKRAKNSTLTELTEEMWLKLDNTDSYDIQKGDWEMVRYHTIEGKPDDPRDWEILKSKIERREALDAPIILKMKDGLHLVSGNTRLMITRALGLNPQALIVDMSDYVAL